MNIDEIREQTVNEMWGNVLDSINQMYDAARKIATDRDRLAALRAQLDR